MNLPCVIADESTAAGYRLAGARVLTPRAGTSVEQAFAAACAQSALVLITAELAAQLPAARLEAALVGSQPLVVIVPDVGGRQTAPDLGRALRAALGVES